MIPGTKESLSLKFWKKVYNHSAVGGRNERIRILNPAWDIDNLKKLNQDFQKLRVQSLALHKKDLWHKFMKYIALFHVITF